MLTTVRITDLLSEGRHVLVRVTKEALGTKGPRITTHVTLPGRYLVLMPTVDQVGVSRKIKSREERMRLRSLIHEMRRGPVGIIVRTAAEGVDAGNLETVFALSRAALGRDQAKRADKSPAPSLVHGDGRPGTRRTGLLWSDVSSIHIDLERAYEQCVDFISKIDPSHGSQGQTLRAGLPDI